MLSLFPLDGRCHVGNLLPRSRSSSSLNSEKTAQKQLRMSPSREVPWTETRPNFLALPFSSCKTTAKSSISGPTATSSHSRLWECNENASWIIPGMKTGTHKLALLEVYLLPHLPNSLLSIVQERWLSKRQMSSHQIPCFNLSLFPVARLLGKNDQTSENLPTASLSGLISGHAAHRITCQVCLTLLHPQTPFHTLSVFSTEQSTPLGQLPLICFRLGLDSTHSAEPTLPGEFATFFPVSMATELQTSVRVRTVVRK